MKHVGRMLTSALPHRSRYNAAFTSSIFEPPPAPDAASFVPAGGRKAIRARHVVT